MIRFEEIAETVQLHHPGADLDVLRRAYVFSAVAHKGQVRASGEPYLSHPLEVASILASWRLDPICVAVGLLHDALEDTLATPKELEEKFGPVVLHIVEGLTKISQISFSSVEERQAESFRKLLLAMVDDVRVILVKLADRLHNMRTLEHLSEEKRIRISEETMEIYAALAGRLGMSRIKNELEDLAFQHLEPEAYKDLSKRVAARRKDADAVIARMSGVIKDLIAEAHIEARIDGRVKRLFSIHQKLIRQKIDLDELYDFIALRVVVNSVSDCYAVLGLLHHALKPVPGRIKDLIAIPRPNGYRSLHTTLVGDHGMPFEVQIRTEEMHRIAEEGIAAHWKYKEGQPASQDDETFAWLRQLLEDVQDPKELMSSLKLDLYPEEVYCFTPKGAVRTLPRGATPIDFAFAIHSEVGRRCVGARVGGRIVPLRTKLKNGDIVEILTAPGHHPSRDWLNFAVTSRARSRIKHDLHLAERQQARDLGRRLIEREWKKSPLRAKTIEEEIAEDRSARPRARCGQPLRRGPVVGGFRPARRRGPRGKAHASRTSRQAAGGAGQVEPTGHAQRRPHLRAGRRSPSRLPGPLLLADPRRPHHRLHHARPGRFGPRGELPEREERDGRRAAAGAGLVGRHSRRDLPGAPQRGGPRSAGPARGHDHRGLRQGRRHTARGSANVRRSPRHGGPRGPGARSRPSQGPRAVGQGYFRRGPG